jgi:DNA-binding HxlR family transcriptional regulator
MINEEVRETGHVLDPGVLSSTLKRMVEDGLVEHREISRFPRTALYSLTPHAYEVVALLKGTSAVASALPPQSPS